MKSRKLIILLIIIFTFLFILGGWILSKKEEETALVNSSLSLSNKKIGWGTKREKSHKQPELGKNNIKLMNENNGIAMGNSDKKYIYLTFDEGHEGGYTSKILDSLKKNNVKATFFITGHYFNSQPDLIKKMIEEGHIVGNHTVNHHSMPSLADEKLREEIIKLHTSVKEKFGYEMKYLRPPMGEFSERTLAYTKDLGYTTVMWSFAYDGWYRCGLHTKALEIL